MERINYKRRAKSLKITTTLAKMTCNVEVLEFALIVIYARVWTSADAFMN